MAHKRTHLSSWGTEPSPRTTIVPTCTNSNRLRPLSIQLSDAGSVAYIYVPLTDSPDYCPGLTLLALNFFATGQDLIGAVCFVLSLGFKQMALYYAPAIGTYLLAKCVYLGPSEG